MNDFSAAEEILKTMLAKLGFETVVTTVEEKDGPCLNIESADSSHIIGKNGDRLEDLQYLLNRIVSKNEAPLPRMKVDCENFRKNQEAQLLEKVRVLADKVKQDSKPARTRPLNAYYRRLVHNALADDEQIITSSPQGDARYKRVTLSKKDA